MRFVKWLAVLVGGLALTAAARLVFGRFAVVVLVATRVWKDPTVQKVRRRIQKKVEKKIDKAQAQARKDAAKR